MNVRTKEEIELLIEMLKVLTRPEDIEVRRRVLSKLKVQVEIEL